LPPKLPTNTIFFDLETGGVSGRVSQIQQIAMRQEGRDILNVFSPPEPGRFLSRWSEGNWENLRPFLGRPGTHTVSEEQALQRTLGVLQAHKGFTLAGWNIGTILQSQVEGAERGAFDIRFLLTRARAYGMEEQFKTALSEMKIRDVGREFAVEIAEEITDPRYASLVEQGVIEEKLYQQAVGYGKQVSIARASQPGVSTPELARMLETSEVRFAGWTQELVEKLAGVSDDATAHAAHVDLARLEKLMASGAPLRGEEFFRGWSTEALRDKLVKSALYPRAEAQPELFAELSATASQFGIDDFESLVEQKARERGASLAEVRLGKGVAEGGRVVGEVGGTVGQKITQVGLKAEAAMARSEAIGIMRKHRGMMAITMGVAALWALEPFGWVSGNDDDYNTIEGLREEGMAGYLRKINTDFGSGWRGLPSHLSGQEIDQAILSFRGGVWDDPELREELQERLRAREQEAQEKLGKLSPEELFFANTSVITGINKKNEELKLVRLQRFWVDVEDADTLVLYRKSAAGALRRLLGRGGISVRLAGIDAPEITAHEDDPLSEVRIFQEQPGGQEAAEFLRSRIEEDETLSLVVGTSRQTYGRYLGSVVSEATGENLSLEMLRRGMVTALPFGPAEEDILARSEAATAEQEAQLDRRGIWAYKRYQAMAIAAEAIGRPITHNTLTRLDKISANLNLGAYTSYLQSLGSDMGELSPEEIRLARRMGRKLRRTHGPRGAYRGNRFSGKDDAWLQIEGLGHEGIAWQIRQAMTDFGSGWIRKALARGVSLESIGRGVEQLTAGKLTTKQVTGYFQRVGEAAISPSMKRFAESQGISSQALLRAHPEIHKTFAKGKAAQDVRSGRGMMEDIRDIIGLHAGGEKWIYGKELGAGGIGEVRRVFGAKSKRVGAFKRAQGDIAEDVNRAYREGLGQGQLGFMKGFQREAVMKEMDFGFADFASSYHGEITKIMQGRGFQTAAQYETAITRLARQAYGEAAPEIYAATKKGIIFENLQSTVTPKILEQGSAALRGTVGAKIQHLDPGFDQILRRGSKAVISDWGLAVPITSGSPLLSAVNREAAQRGMRRAFTEKFKRKTLARQKADLKIKGQKTQIDRLQPLEMRVEQIKAQVKMVNTMQNIRQKMKRRWRKAYGKSGG
jgi:endonuclease YncB( thermonuclease family)